jgi:hypothetical protein
MFMSSPKMVLEAGIDTELDTTELFNTISMRPLIYGEIILLIFILVIKNPYSFGSPYKLMLMLFNPSFRYV